MKRHTRSGVSLVEVLFAMFLVVLCALIVAATMPIADISRGKANLLEKASGLAQKQLEAIRGLGYANATPTQLQAAGLIDSTTPVGANTYTFTNSDSANLDNPGLVLPNGSGTVTLTTSGFSTATVTVTVNYSDNQRNQSVSVGTILANL